ncbi:MBL fold metallo-hydrolase [Sphingomonas aracearum]|uniref:MBL fold metallo-hydrolase n=1 Tax=Sphingomonas aracearum TaxID=2283317 RepID=A0A369W1X5_9SPHN|nr:MBL fold metallo-hydrolase [Sphingomonas aracearum]RDE07360.1 MBL fold metallo-hydrolase [Sphingomonas aracearum]
MKTITLGEISIAKVTEVDTMWFDPAWLYHNIQDDMLLRHKEQLGPRLIDPVSNKLALSFHSFLIQTGGLNILVDTCNGNHKNRDPRFPFYSNLKATTYLDNLARLGLRPDDIDMVLCTHLHTDHVGWNTYLSNGEWVPTFPRARYVMARQEFDHFNRLHAARPDYPVGHGSFEDSVLPVVRAGLAQFVDMDHLVAGEIGNGVWMEPAVGHTPGHVTIHAKGGGRESIMTGDIIHHPILFLEPGLETKHDVDKVTCDATRQRLLRRLADTDDILLSAHFCDPTAGTVRSRPNGFAFAFLDE